MRLYTILMAGVALCASPIAANATLTLVSGVDGGSGDVDNVIFNACNLNPGPALTVQGCLNTNHTTLVNFTSTENLLISGGGQAVTGRRLRNATMAPSPARIRNGSPGSSRCAKSVTKSGKVAKRIEASPEGTYCSLQ